MLLTIHNLPASTRYADVKTLLQAKCGLQHVILDNLLPDGNGKQVTVGVAEEEDAAILVRKINGLYMDGQQLYVQDVRQKKTASEQPFRSTKPQKFQHDNEISNQMQQYGYQNQPQKPTGTNIMPDVQPMMTAMYYVPYTQDYTAYGQGLDQSGQNLGQSGQSFGMSAQAFGQSGQSYGQSDQTYGQTAQNYGQSTQNFMQLAQKVQNSYMGVGGFATQTTTQTSQFGSTRPLNKNQNIPQSKNQNFDTWETANYEEEEEKNLFGRRSPRAGRSDWVPDQTAAPARDRSRDNSWIPPLNDNRGLRQESRQNFSADPGRSRGSIGKPTPEFRPEQGRSTERAQFDRSDDRQQPFGRSNDKPQPFVRSNEQLQPFGRSNERPPFDRSSERPQFVRSDERPQFNRSDERSQFGRSDERPQLGRSNQKPQPFRRSNERSQFDRSNDKPQAFVRSNEGPKFDRSNDRSEFIRSERPQLGRSNEPPSLLSRPVSRPTMLGRPDRSGFGRSERPFTRSDRPEARSSQSGQYDSYGAKRSSTAPKNERKRRFAELQAEGPGMERPQRLSRPDNYKRHPSPPKPFRPNQVYEPRSKFPKPAFDNDPAKSVYTAKQQEKYKLQTRLKGVRKIIADMQTNLNIINPNLITRQVFKKYITERVEPLVSGRDFVPAEEIVEIYRAVYCKEDDKAAYDNILERIAKIQAAEALRAEQPGTSNRNVAEPFLKPAPVQPKVKNQKPKAVQSTTRVPSFPEGEKKNLANAQFLKKTFENEIAKTSTDKNQNMENESPISEADIERLDGMSTLRVFTATTQIVDLTKIPDATNNLDPTTISNTSNIPDPIRITYTSQISNFTKISHPTTTSNPTTISDPTGSVKKLNRNARRRLKAKALAAGLNPMKAIDMAGLSNIGEQQLAGVEKTSVTATTEISDLPEISNPTKTSDLPETSNCTEISDLPEISNPTKTSDLPELSNPTKTSDLPEISNCTKISDPTMTSDLPEISNCFEISDPTNLPEISNCTETSDPTKKSDLPEISNCTKISDPTKTSDTTGVVDKLSNMASKSLRTEELVAGLNPMAIGTGIGPAVTEVADPSKIDDQKLAGMEGMSSLPMVTTTVKTSDPNKMLDTNSIIDLTETSDTTESVIDHFSQTLSNSLRVRSFAAVLNPMMIGTGISPDVTEMAGPSNIEDQNLAGRNSFVQTNTSKIEIQLANTSGNQTKLIMEKSMTLMNVGIGTELNAQPSTSTALGSNDGLTKKQRRNRKRGKRRRTTAKWMDPNHQRDFEGQLPPPEVQTSAAPTPLETSVQAICWPSFGHSVSTYTTQTGLGLPPNLPDAAVGIGKSVASNLKSIPAKPKGDGKGIGQKASIDDSVSALLASGIPVECDRTTVGKRHSSDLMLPSIKKMKIEADRGSFGTGHFASDVDGPSTTKYHSVVILDRSGWNLTHLQATALRRDLEKGCELFYYLNKHRKDDHRPRFGKLPRLFRGGLKVEAKDNFTLNWLNNYVRKLPGKRPESGGFIVVPEKKLPVLFKGPVFVPDFDRSAVDIKSFLAFFNDTETLKINNWRIFSHKVMRDKDIVNNLVVFGIPIEDEPELRRMGYRLAYKTASVYIMVRRPGDVGTIMAPGTSGVAGEQWPITKVCSDERDYLMEDEDDRFIGEIGKTADA